MNSNTERIRRATPADAAMLTEFSLRSKAVWNYPPEWMETFRPELTLTPERLETIPAFVLEVDGRAVGYYSLLPRSADEVELWHLFVRPGTLRRGYGSRLFTHAMSTAAELGYRRVVIQSDPNAAGFYERQGARKVSDIPSCIPNRTIPLFEVILPTGAVPV
jgi:GNAT superfamily N-acetyltransferase